jgi:hypothetical protein
LVCSILIGSGVSVSDYLSKSDLELPSNKDMLDQCENLGTQAQKYYVDHGIAGFSNWQFPQHLYNQTVYDFSIDLITKDSLIFSVAPKTAEKIHWKIQTTVTKNEIIFSPIN